MQTFVQMRQSTSATSAIQDRRSCAQTLGVTAIQQLERTIGNRAVQRKLLTDTDKASLPTGREANRISPRSAATAAIRRSPAVSEPGDDYEREADRTAEQVMRSPAPHLQGCQCGGRCPDCRTPHQIPDRGTVQTRHRVAGDIGPGTAAVDDVLRSPGEPLDSATRAYMEPRFGYDFSQVRVHTGAAAEESAHALNAQAYTVGHEVVFGAGRFAPGTSSGLRLIAHELAHTVQQSSGASAVIARQPQAPFAFNQQDAVYLRNTMLNFYGLLPPDARASLYRNTTVVIALVSHDNQPTLVYTVASNSTSPAIRAAAEQLGLTRWDPDGIDKVAGERHAEQLTFETSRKLGFRMHGMVVTREPCADCAPVVADRGIPIEWVRDPAPPPRTPRGPVGGPPPGGGVPPPAPGRSPGGGTTSTPPAGNSTATARTGAPLEPVVEGTPGFNPGRGAGIGGAVQMIQAMMVGNLQRAEIDKLNKRLTALEPRIEAFLAGGYSVELTLIVEKPNTVDLLCVGKVYCDAGQLTYFRALYISRVESTKPIRIVAPPTTHATMGPRGGRDSFIPYTHQGGSIIDESEIPYLSAEHGEHHTEYAKQTLYPQPQHLLSPVTERRAPAQQVKPKPVLDEATKKAMAAAPSRVWVLSGNINQYKTAYEVMKKLAGNPSFGEVKEEMSGGLTRSRTTVVYFSDLDKPRAEALAEIVRAQGVLSARAERSGGGDDDPGSVQIMFGSDAER